MNDKITATVNAFTATVNAFNPETNEIETFRTAIPSKATATATATAAATDKGLLFCEITSLEKGASGKIEIDAQTFFARAEKMDRRPNGAYISRNVCVYDVAILAYSLNTHSVKACTFKIDTDNANAIERKAKSYCRANELKFLKSNGIISENKALYVMSIDDAMKWGKFTPFVE